MTTVFGITPKFAYNPGTGVVDLVPTWPPVNKTPYSPLEAVRHDSITSTGIKQSVTERIDAMLVLSFESVPEDDMSAWYSFFKWTLAGNQFTYYPDQSDATIFAEYTLEDESWAPKRAGFKLYSFNAKFRPYVGSNSEHFS